MPKFTIDFVLMEHTQRRVEVEADSEEEALEAFACGEIDYADSYQVDCLKYEADFPQIIK